ncbi:hypothetical protein ACFLVS_01025 [Chloroflexota bacterium]
MKSIFSALAKYSLPQDENYLTEAFVFLINSLLISEKSIGTQLLNSLCAESDEAVFDTEDEISVSTQYVTDLGTPDIKVSAQDKLVYVEVKDYSPVKARQLKHYREVLETSDCESQRLILLTRYAVDYIDHKGIPDRQVCWFEVYNWLTCLETQDSVSAYLINSFKSFLEDRRMSIERVSWEYINGVPSFNNLINMIEAAIKNVGITFHKKKPRAAAWDSKGFWLNNKKYYCGIYYNAPLTVVFKAFHKKDLNMDNVQIPSYPTKEAFASIWFMLQLEDIHFFALDKDIQLEKITKFIGTAYNEAEQMRGE